MPRRCLTSGRKFSTTTSARAAILFSSATPSGALRSSVMLRLLRCRFMKSEPLRPAETFAVGAALRHLDLDDLGTPVGELAHAGRTGAHTRQIEHGEARPGGGRRQ